MCFRINCILSAIEFYTCLERNSVKNLEFWNTMFIFSISIRCILILAIATNMFTMTMKNQRASWRQRNVYFNEYETTFIIVLWKKFSQLIIWTANHYKTLGPIYSQGQIFRILSKCMIGVRKKFNRIERIANLLTDKWNYTKQPDLKKTLQFVKTAHNTRTVSNGRTRRIRLTTCYCLPTF